jgi:indolepyruvate ferredoxin oxidoreductase, beta subunit
MVMLGAASPFLGLEYDKLKDAISFFFGKKGQDLVDLNLKALEAGREFAKENIH